MKQADLDLYTDYLLSTFGAATATGLSAMVEGEVSHDRITRFLSGQNFTSRDLWQHVNKLLDFILATQIKVRPLPSCGRGRNAFEGEWVKVRCSVHDQVSRNS